MPLRRRWSLKLSASRDVTSEVGGALFFDACQAPPLGLLFLTLRVSRMRAFAGDFESADESGRGAHSFSIKEPAGREAHRRFQGERVMLYWCCSSDLTQ